MKPNVSCIKPEIDRAEAEAHFFRQRLVWLRRPARRLLAAVLPGVRRRWRARAEDNRDLVELVRLPHYHVSVALDGEGRRSRIVVLVSGYERQAKLVDFSSVRWQDSAGRECFEPDVSAAEAAQIAHRTLMAAALRRSAWARGAAELAATDVRLVHYPFWVHYFKCRRQRVGVAILDGLTGKPTGPGMRIALLSALASRAVHAGTQEGTPDG
ncbi:MAG: hypothetical protein BMS9Abin04_509 [Planctomycetia bacterium]|nr:MAG: hypothetical protein BMS9Abin04_509 [Planctomycetia bacterium]